jgi:hypothetical protein
MTDETVRTPENIRNRFKNLCPIIHNDIYGPQVLTPWDVKMRLRRHYSYLIRKDRELSRDVKARSDACIPARVFEDERYGLNITKEQFDSGRFLDDASSDEDEDDEELVPVRAAALGSFPPSHPKKVLAARAITNPLFQIKRPIMDISVKDATEKGMVLSSDVESESSKEEVQIKKVKIKKVALRNSKKGVTGKDEREPAGKKAATPAQTRSKIKSVFGNQFTSVKKPGVSKPKK